MALSREYTYAFDDSGGVEPLLNKKREFAPGDHPFFLIAAIGLNNSLLNDFRAEWQQLRSEIQVHLGPDDLPPLHARLMFGDKKPPTYRGAPNPYLMASRDEILGWYMRGIRIVGKFLKVKRGGDILTAVYSREESGKPWETTFRHEKAEAEAEYLKLADRKRFPKFHQKYVAHVSSALIMPTLDAFMGIQETMRQSGNTCAILLDGYSDADGFNDTAAFGFLNEHLHLSCISTVKSVADSDREPLCQAADLIAYAQFRSTLAEWRQLPEESWVRETRTLLSAPSLCALDVPKWLLRHRAKPEIRAVYNAARFAVAHHTLTQYAPELVGHALQTPTEFLAQCRAVPSDVMKNASGDLYLPILKNGILKTWKAARAENGEDRSKSGPVQAE